jgi:hypothetical protein
MAGFPGKPEFKPAEPLLPDAGMQGRRGFGNQAITGRKKTFFKQEPYSVLAPGLFVTHKKEGCWQGLTGFKKGIAGREDGGDTAFHIACTPAPDISPFDGPGKRGALPALFKGRYYIHMPAEHERTGISPGHQVATSPGRTNNIRFYAPVGEKVPDISYGSGGIARRVFTPHRDKVRTDNIRLHHKGFR